MLHNNLLIKLDEAETKTASGLYLVHTNEEKEKRHGTVIAAGPGLKGVPTLIQPGDRVFIEINSAMETELDGQTLHIVSAQNVLAIVDSE